MSSLLSSFQQYLPAVTIISLPTLGALAVNSFLNKDGFKQWIQRLKKPSFNPPNWIFPPVWLTHYACMGVSSYLIFREGGFQAQAFPLAVYGGFLAINMMWRPLYVGLRRIDLAFYNIIALWFSIATTAYVFYPVNRTAALLLLPQLCWITFASYLNYTILKLNGPYGRKASTPAVKES